MVDMEGKMISRICEIILICIITYMVFVASPIIGIIWIIALIAIGEK